MRIPVAQVRNICTKCSTRKQTYLENNYDELAGCINVSINQQIALWKTSGGSSFGQAQIFTARPLGECDQTEPALLRFGHQVQVQEKKKVSDLFDQTLSAGLFLERWSFQLFPSTYSCQLFQIGNEIEWEYQMEARYHLFSFIFSETNVRHVGIFPIGDSGNSATSMSDEIWERGLIAAFRGLRWTCFLDFLSSAH
jgi:hypothetical protein